MGPRSTRGVCPSSSSVSPPPRHGSASGPVEKTIQQAVDAFAPHCAALRLTDHSPGSQHPQAGFPLAA